MRLLRRMLMRLLWPQLPFSERSRLAREVRRLMSDLTLALLILENGLENNKNVQRTGDMTSATPRSSRRTGTSS